MNMNGGGGTEQLRLVVDGLNNPPFNRALTLVKLDSMSGDALLQTLSDVIGWIEGQSSTEFVDIRSEAPDETILSALRVLKYPPPRDIDQIQRWRLTLLEGQKSAVHPILEWIFSNVDRLKERVYLASFLTRVEVPLEEQSQEVERLVNTVEQKMEEFKSLHSKNVETRADFVRAMDVRNDLKTMEEEKEQLQRKIERCKRRVVARRPDMGNLLEMAAQYRTELERNHELQLQKQDQKKAIGHAEQRVARLERALAETERRQEGTDPRVAIQRMKREMEVNRYLLYEKLEQDIRAQRKNLEVVQRILAQKNATKTDVEKLKEQIEQLNSECMELALQRDRRDETSEEHRPGDQIGGTMVVYRHQAANTQRKKANVANVLQQTKQELDNTEALVNGKRRELGERTGKDEVITSVQYRALLNKLRSKSNIYKRKKAEMEQLKGEQQILERTLELLEERFEQLREANQSEGRGMIERLDERAIDSVKQRPTTAKPESNDVQRLKQMVELINEQINDRRAEVARLNAEIEEFYGENKEKNERFYALKAEMDALEEESARERKETEEKIELTARRLREASAEMERNNAEVQKNKWLAENGASAEQADYALQQLEHQRNDCSQKITTLNRELTSLVGRTELAEQAEMWQNLAKMFELKLQLKKNNPRKEDESKPWGDRRSFY